LSGAVTIGGQPASSVRLTFQSNGNPQREWRARIKPDGTYRVKLQGDADLVCARVERNRPLNSYSDCRRFAAGTHRVDFDFPPGVIRIEVPPLADRRSDIQELADHFLRRARIVGRIPSFGTPMFCGNAEGAGSEDHDDQIKQTQDEKCFCHTGSARAQ
jgi:hypothetical protein